MKLFSSNRTTERMQGNQDRTARTGYLKSFMQDSGLSLHYVEEPHRRPFGPSGVALAWILPQPEQSADVVQSAKTFALTTKGYFGEVRKATDGSLISHRFIKVPKLLDHVLGKPLDSTGMTAGAMIGSTSGEMVRVVKIDTNLQASQAVDVGAEAYESVDQAPLSTEDYPLFVAA